MSFDNINWIWKNGEIIPWANATVHVSAHGLHYGSGVFEGIRCYETADGAAFLRVKEHYERFHASAEVYNFEIPYSVELVNSSAATNLKAVMCARFVLWDREVWAFFREIVRRKFRLWRGIGARIWERKVWKKEFA